MSRWIKSLVVLFGVSILGNVYLFYLVINWQEAWLEQILTTSEIERLYRKSSADVSIEGVTALAAKEKIDVKMVPIEESDNLWLKGEKKVLLLNDTRLFFVDDQYVGSRADLPKEMSHWGFGQEKF